MFANITKDKLPQSISNFWLNLSVFAFYTALFFGFGVFKRLDSAYAVILFVTAIVVTIFLGETFIALRGEISIVGRKITGNLKTHIREFDFKNRYISDNNRESTLHA